MATGGSVEPVFIRNQDKPDSEHEPVGVIEICHDAEAVSGEETIFGAQNIRDLWRIYPKSGEARQLLLARGIMIREVMLQPMHTNPYSVPDQIGKEIPVTKVWIDNIPISCLNDEIEVSSRRIGCEIRSKIVEERERGKDKKLTRFVTGRRYVYISTPEKPLDKTLEIAGGLLVRVPDSSRLTTWLAYRL